MESFQMPINTTVFRLERINSDMIAGRSVNEAHSAVASLNNK